MSDLLSNCYFFHEKLLNILVINKFLCNKLQKFSMKDNSPDDLRCYPVGMTDFLAVKGVLNVDPRFFTRKKSL